MADSVTKGEFLREARRNEWDEKHVIEAESFSNQLVESQLIDTLLLLPRHYFYLITNSGLLAFQEKLNTLKSMTDAEILRRRL